MSSLDRLIDLAKKTKDRLIVHDPIEGRDVVIMDVDEYEKMWDRQNETEMESDVRGLSGRGLVDKINRDIAIWRAEQDMEEEWNSDDFMPGGIYPHTDPWDEPWHHDHAGDWHSAGDVLNERSKDQMITRLEDHEFDFDDFGEEEINVKDTPFDSDINFSAKGGPAVGWEIPDFSLPEEEVPMSNEEEIKVDDLPWDLPDEEIKTTPIPLGEHNDEYIADGGALKEEKLDSDEPVFYEEPV